MTPAVAAGTTIAPTRAAHSPNASERLQGAVINGACSAVLRGLAAASLAVLTLTVSTPVHAAETLSLTEAIAAVPVADESREGYTRDAFRHWNSDDNPTDGCPTRNEVLLDEAVEPPTVGSRCALSGGLRFSCYDQVWVTSASGLDIDHLVSVAATI
ncbi:hypothetical protein ACIRFH_28845 [Streptomyces sp. NPDC093586]|uniref:hypothetical protein n=1 Tax=Streptomyces sp. NPDC093586 TaxID=3366042 RepID=UPI003825FE72